MNPDYSKLRGFNYQPGYSAGLEYTWTCFDRKCWEREVPLALRFGANILRVWLDWHAFLCLGGKLLEVFDQALAVLDRHGLKMMPVLFNRWVDDLYPAGGISDQDLRCWGWSLEKFDAYVDALGRNFGRDRRILIWDVCNEPLGGWGAAELWFKEHVWLANVTDRLRRHARQPITIGTMTYDSVLQAAALVDVISFHPYPRQAGDMDKLCLDHLAIAKRFGKPLLATETCTGSLDDSERGALARDSLETLERHGIGWIAWHLCEGRFVTAGRERPDNNSLRPREGYMPFVLADGRTRPGHEWLEKQRAPRRRRA